MFEVDSTNITNITDISLALNLSPLSYYILILYNSLIVLLGLTCNGLVLLGKRSNRTKESYDDILCC